MLSKLKPGMRVKIYKCPIVKTDFEGWATVQQILSVELKNRGIDVKVKCIVNFDDYWGDYYRTIVLNNNEPPRNQKIPSNQRKKN